VLIVVCASTADDVNNHEATSTSMQNRALAREDLVLSIVHLSFPLFPSAVAPKLLFRNQL
jgi:hypothetical protein